MSAQTSRRFLAFEAQALRHERWWLHGCSSNPLAQLDKSLPNRHKKLSTYVSGDLREPFFDNQHFPFRRIIKHCSRRPFLYLMCCQILLCGAWAQHVFGNNYFSRSGAVIAIFALLLLWLWLKYNQSLEETLVYVESMQKSYSREGENDIGGIYTRVNQILRNNPLTSPIASSLALQIAANAHAAINDGPQLNSDLRIVSKNLSYGQIEVAAIGTFVWAFGDLAWFV